MALSPELVRILYECAMSLETGLDMDKFLRGSLSGILRKISCAAGGVHFLEPMEDGRFGLLRAFSIPRDTGSIVEYRDALERLPERPSPEELAEFRASLPITGRTSGGGQFHILDLPDVGFVILVKRGEGLPRRTVHSLRPIFARLALGCVACRHNEELKRHRTNLREMVERTSQELVQRNEQLALEVAVRKRTEQALEKLNIELERLASIDGLTQVANRRVFDERVAEEWLRMIRQGECLSLILCDIDFFKNYNDLYGHLSGDDCLRKVARAIAACIKRPGDLLARYGGEEFVALLPGTALDGALALAGKMHAAVAGLEMVHEGSSVDRHVSLSLGVASLIPETGGDHEALIALADKALYKAKDGGRNRIETMGEE